MRGRPGPAQPDRRLRPRWERERRRQRVAIIVGVAIVLLVLAIPAYGYYSNFIAPPRTVAARIRDTAFTMGDLVKQIRIIQAAGRYSGQRVDMSVAPFTVLYSMVESELVRQAAPGYGITVTQADVEERLRGNFYPSVSEGQESDPGQLEREFKENYRNFLTTTRLSEKEYERMLISQIYRERLREELGARVPTVADQVEAYWIRLPTDGDPEEAKERLAKGEDFGALAKELSTDRTYADEKGYVGWVPRGAFPGLEEALFSLEHDTISDPVYTEQGTYLIKVVAGPEVRDVSPRMREKLKDEGLQAWLLEQWKEGQEEGWLFLNFDSDWYDWVVKQIRSSASEAQAASGQR